MICDICSTDIAIYSSHGWVYVNDILSDKMLIYKQDFSAISFTSISFTSFTTEASVLIFHRAIFYILYTVH